MPDTFNTLQDALQGFGVSLVERTRLTFGPQVLKAVATLAQDGRVLVATDPLAIKLHEALNGDAKGKVVMVDATASDYAKVRPHVNTFAKSRKVNLSINPLKGPDGFIGFTVHKSA